MIGKTVGHSQITEKLGEGGTGVVYKARDTRLDRFVALKILRPEKVADPDRRRRFLQEAKLPPPSLIPISAPSMTSRFAHSTLHRTNTFKEANMAEANAPNVALDLLRIHSIITRGLNEATSKSEQFAQEGFPDGSTREGFICYARSFVSVLHAHHLTENELAFPYLREKLPDAPYDLLIAQHQELVHILDQIRVRVEEVAASPQVAASLSKLNVVLKSIGEMWHPHIGIEQDYFAPEKVGPLLPPKEHIRLSGLFMEHSRKNSGPDYLVVPFLLYNLAPEERVFFARKMPLIVTRLLVPVIWKKQWAPMRPFLLS